MEDLRILEQQQRESQRKLAMIKLTKQSKLEQRSSLESKLSSLKYANGEQRAQLVRARDVLSRSTRELGSAKLYSDKSADALKGFDGRLKKALLSSRILHGLCRKVDSEIIVLRNKKVIILRLKSQVADGLNAAKKRHDDAQFREQSLREAIQDEKIKAKNLLEQTTSIRSDVTGLKQDLAMAQQMAASTKMRAESITAEIVAEDKRHEAAMQEMRSKLEAAEKQLAEKKARDEALQKDIEFKKVQLHEAWKRCVQYQQEEGHDLSPEPTDDGRAPSLDVDKLRASLEQERAALLEEKAERDRLKESLLTSEEELSDLVSKEAAAREEADSIRKTAEVTEKVERDRREANDKCLEELEKERRSVGDLRRSVSELEESISLKRKRLGDRYSEQTKAIEKRQAELEESKAELAAADTTIQELESEFEKDEEDNARLVEAAMQDADSARAVFEEARQDIEALENASDSEIQKNVEDIEQAQSILLEDTKDEIARLCEGKCFTSYRLTCYPIHHSCAYKSLLLADYPALEEVEVDYDPNKTTEEQAEEALSNLRADCEDRVEHARAQKKAAERSNLALKKEKEAAERKAQLRAQRKEAEASKKRKEERRNERMRKEAKQRETLLDDERDILNSTCFEDGGKHKRRFSGGGILAPVQHVYDEAEEEPLAASQKRIRFEDEVDVSSLITKEVGNSRGRETKRSYGKSHSRACGRRESSSSGKSKLKERESSLKEPSLSRSASVDEKVSRSRHDDSKSNLKERESSLRESSRSRSASVVDKVSRERHEVSKSSKRIDSVDASRGHRLSKPESTKSRSSKDHHSRPSSFAPESRPTKRPKERDADSTVTIRASVRKSKDRLASDASSSKVDHSHDALGKKSQSSSCSIAKSSSREARDSKNDDGRSLESQSMTTHTSSRSSTAKSSRREAPEMKPDDSRSVSSRGKESHSSSRSSTKSSSELKKDIRAVSSQYSKSHTPSRSSTKSSSHRAPEKEDDNSKVSSQKASRSESSHKTSRTTSSHKSSRSVPTQKSSNKRKASRDSECASQASGISTMERVTKSRRRKKKDGPTTNKSKMTAFSSMEDVDFHF